MGKSVSVGGTQSAKWQNFKFHKFCSTEGIYFKFSPDLTYNEVFPWTKISGCTLTMTVAITKDNEFQEPGADPKFKIIFLPSSCTASQNEVFCLFLRKTGPKNL